MDNRRIEAGSVVQLKSGGPKMTVRAMDSGENPTVTCQWFFKNSIEAWKLKEGTFFANQLEIAHHLPTLAS